MRLRFRPRRTRIVAGLTLVVVGLAAGVAHAVTPGVDPASVTTTLNPGQSVTVTKTVHTPTIPPKPDIVFLADTTGSMGPALANVQANATSVMNAVRLAQSDSDFAAAQYKDVDCGDPLAFNLDQSISASIPAVQTAMSTWTAGGGCDTPEDQVNALYQLATSGSVGFRASSTRVVVWFGDASGHDPSNGHTLTDAINALVAANIEVIAIPVSGSGDGLDSTGQATAIATATGGSVLPSATPGEVSAAILSGLSNLPVTVTPSPTCDPDLSATFAPSTPQTVTSGADVTYDETITVDPGNAGGTTLHCTVDFKLNGLSGGPAFTQSVTVNVNGAPNCAGVTAGPDLWPPNHKLKLITLTGATDPDGNPVALTITGVTQDEPLNGLGDGDTSPDAAAGTASSNVYLRAERSGLGDGRVYRIAFTGSDGAGGTCTGVATVGVPHDQGGGSVAIDSGFMFSSF